MKEELKHKSNFIVFILKIKIRKIKRRSKSIATRLRRIMKMKIMKKRKKVMMRMMKKLQK